MGPVYRGGRYTLYDDPGEWPESIPALIAHLQMMADQGYERVGVGEACGSSFASFRRPATPDEVAMEREAHARLMGRGGE